MCQKFSISLPTAEVGLARRHKKGLGDNVSILRFINRILRWCWRWGTAPADGIDCHKWETKVEVFRDLSSKR